MPHDDVDLSRFAAEQEHTYDQALAEVFHCLVEEYDDGQPDPKTTELLTHRAGS